ncbi:MAG: CUAEP/CCAEP-tail radical SAM protein [Acidobacteriota bacterium]|nr:CUAEP/CCAEP-tail radical SAM protein [Acidobacteriota bacterium]
MRIVLLSTYELGRQPFGLASPAAQLRASGHAVTAADLARGPFPWLEIQKAELVAFYLPMHTATRLALHAIDRVRSLNSEARLCAFGLYAPMNADYLRKKGVGAILGGEFEPGLVELANTGRAPAAAISLERQRFATPDRAGLPPLTAYAKLLGSGAPKLAGYTEASRGCKHRCKHCPVAPVYNGVFRIVQRDVVLADVRQQVAAGAEHITFGDPDFFNGIGHALPLIEALHAEFPRLTYDATIKIEHLLKHREALPVLRRTGCLFIVSAVESVDDAVLSKLAKGHTRADFHEALRLTRKAGLHLSPTFIPFTPWTTLESYRDLLRAVRDLDLADSVAAIQLAIRLLIPAGSLLLELDEIRHIVEPFDPEALCYRWKNSDPAVDRLCAGIGDVVQREAAKPRAEVFGKIWELAFDELTVPPDFHLAARATVPYLNEPWYC